MNLRPPSAQWRWNVKAEKKKTHEEENVPVKTKIQREIIAWFWVGLAFLLINGTIGQARVIPSGSMENTLLIGDHLIMSRIGYDAGVPFTNWHVPLWRNPKRQQVIIFKPPFAPETPDYVKRVIGLPGDTIDIHDGAVWVNGQKQIEKYTTGPTEPPPATTIRLILDSTPCGFLTKFLRTVTWYSVIIEAIHSTAASGAASRAMILLARR